MAAAGRHRRRRLARRDRDGQCPGRGCGVLSGLVADEHGAADPPGLLDPEQVSAGPRSRAPPHLAPDQRALPIPELASAGAIYAYSFILTNLDVTVPDKGAAAEHWYRHRTTVENNFPRRQARRRAAAPPQRIPPGQHGLDVGGAARRENRRLAPPPHCDHRRRRYPGRARRARRQSHDRHPPPAADRRPRQADPPRPPPDAEALARPLPASRDPHPAGAATSTGLTCAPTAPLPVFCPRPASPSPQKGT